MKRTFLYLFVLPIRIFGVLLVHISCISPYMKSLSLTICYVGAFHFANTGSSEFVSEFPPMLPVELFRTLAFVWMT